MPKITVVTDKAACELPFSSGPTLREILESAGLEIRSGCLGNGACGLCLVQVEAGGTNSHTKNECLLLSPEQLRGNVRLACQIVPEDDLRIRIINRMPKSNWKDLGSGLLPCSPICQHPLTEVRRSEAVYGLAIDLGTTHISLSLLDLRAGRRLSCRIGANPQSFCGADVVTRLTAAVQSEELALRLARMPLDAIHEALMDMLSRSGLDPRKVIDVAIVGNTSMLALLTKTDPGMLLQPRSWTQTIDCEAYNPRTWASIMGIHPDASADVISPFAGFVGSDLLADVLATHLMDRPGGLLIDFGTNSEMALWDGEALWVTSAAGGPAFEGCQVRCGMPAEEERFIVLKSIRIPVVYTFR